MAVAKDRLVSSRRRDPSETNTLGVSTTTRKQRKETEVEQQRQYVGIDLHRRRSVMVRMSEDGQVLGVEQVVNDPLELAAAVAKAGPEPEVAVESTYGWYWAVDLLQENGAQVHLVHPLGLHWDTRRVKNDVRDSTELAHRLRRGDLPESYIAPPDQRELRELVRYRFKLTSLRTSAKAQIHAVMAKEGILPTLDDMFGPGGRQLIEQMPFEGAYKLRVTSLLELLDHYARDSLSSRLSSPTASPAIRAMRPSRRSREWGRSWRRSSSPRSATCPASRPPAICVRGRG
jgi:hypothetical protein